MAGGIEPTMAYDMEDDESNDGIKEQEEVYFVIHFSEKLTNHDTQRLMLDYMSHI